MQQKRKTHPIILSIQLGIVGLLVVAGLNYQAILDQYALESFRPSAEMAAIEDRLDMTQKARAVFYRAAPQIDDKATFNHNCETRSQELELGCFYRSRIFVLRIENDNLATEMDVVTAHELLHAVWARMGQNERNTIGAELERVYGQVADDELEQRMDGYDKTEPGERKNELHSILATEFESLSPTLETHYAKYFTNRSQIVAAHAAYKNVFTTRRAELEQELAAIRAEKGRLGVLNRQMESYKQSGQIEQYNALVPRQNRMVDEINDRIEAYRLAVEEYNALSKSLDSQEITSTEAPVQ